MWVRGYEQVRRGLSRSSREILLELCLCLLFGGRLNGLGDLAGLKHGLALVLRSFLALLHTHDGSLFPHLHIPFRLAEGTACDRHVLHKVLEDRASGREVPCRAEPNMRYAAGHARGAGQEWRAERSREGEAGNGRNSLLQRLRPVVGSLEERPRSMWDVGRRRKGAWST